MPFDITNFAPMAHTGLINVFSYNAVPSGDDNIAASGTNFFNPVNALSEFAESPLVKGGDMMLTRTTDRSIGMRNFTLVNTTPLTLIGVVYNPVDA